MSVGHNQMSIVGNFNRLRFVGEGGLEFSLHSSSELSSLSSHQPDRNVAYLSANITPQLLPPITRRILQPLNLVDISRDSQGRIVIGMTGIKALVNPKATLVFKGVTYPLQITSNPQSRTRAINDCVDTDNCIGCCDDKFDQCVAGCDEPGCRTICSHNLDACMRPCNRQTVTLPEEISDGSGIADLNVSTDEETYSAKVVFPPQGSTPACTIRDIFQQGDYLVVEVAEYGVTITISNSQGNSETRQSNPESFSFYVGDWPRGEVHIETSSDNCMDTDVYTLT